MSCNHKTRIIKVQTTISRVDLWGPRRTPSLEFRADKGSGVLHRTACRQCSHSGQAKSTNGALGWLNKQTCCVWSTFSGLEVIFVMIYSSQLRLSGNIINKPSPALYTFSVRSVPLHQYWSSSELRSNIFSGMIPYRTFAELASRCMVLSPGKASWFKKSGLKHPKHVTVVTSVFHQAQNGTSNMLESTY